MTSKLIPLVLLLVMPLPAPAQQGAASAPESAESAPRTEGVAPRAEPAADTGPVPETAELAFDPAEIGLPGLPQPMRSADDFQTALDLIDGRIGQLEALLESVEAAAARAAAGDDGIAGPMAEPHDGAATDAERIDGAEPATDGDAARDLDATATGIANRIDLLRELGLAVQRRATLTERLAAVYDELARGRQEIESIERHGIALEPPYPVSLLDQEQAELALKQGVEDVAEARLVTAKRRLSAAERALPPAVRERRGARDRLSEADACTRRDADWPVGVAERRAAQNDSASGHHRRRSNDEAHIGKRCWIEPQKGAPENSRSPEESARCR